MCPSWPGHMPPAVQMLCLTAVGRGPLCSCCSMSPLPAPGHLPSNLALGGRAAPSQGETGPSITCPWLMRRGGPGKLPRGVGI